MMVLTMSACSGSSESEPVDVSKSFINVTPTVDMLGNGDTKDVDIRANCSWTIANSSTEWLTVNPASGSGEGRVTLTAGKNTTGHQRTAVLTIAGGGIERKLTVNQNIPDEELTVNPTEMMFKVEGETKTLNIVSNGNWSIEKPEWCMVSKTAGFGNAELQVTVSLNESADERTADLVVRGDVAQRVVHLQQAVAEKAVISSCEMVNITASSADVNIAFSSVLPATAWGVCYSVTNSQPTLDDDHVDCSGDDKSGSVKVTLKGLKRNTHYYVRPYVTTVVGTQLGAMIEFTTLDDVPGGDDNVLPSSR